MISTLFLLIILTIISCLIVGLWRKHPVWAFIIAGLILVLPIPIIGMIKTFQAMMIYGTGDPQLMAGGISEAMMSTFLTVPIGLPLLALFQWSIRRLIRKKDSRVDVENTFL